MEVLTLAELARQRQAQAGQVAGRRWALVLRALLRAAADGVVLGLVTTAAALAAQAAAHGAGTDYPFQALILFWLRLPGAATVLHLALVAQVEAAGLVALAVLAQAAGVLEALAQRVALVGVARVAQ